MNYLELVLNRLSVVSPRLNAAVGSVFTFVLASAMSLAPAPANAKTLDDPLRWMPSTSSGVAGYVVHVGSSGGFRSSGSGISIDIGQNFSTTSGVAQRRLGDLLSVSSHVVMQAYDSAGLYSVDSNEIYVTIAPSAPSPTPEPTPTPTPEATPLPTATPTPTPIPSPTPQPTPPPEVEEPLGSAIYDERFDGYSPGQEANGWFDTAANNSMVQDDGLFYTAADGGNVVFQTSSTGTNIHSHLVSGDSRAWSNYELSGRMQLAHVKGGIGVTVYSDYANSDSYYRLRRYKGAPTFQLSSHYRGGGSAACVGTTDSGVNPQANTWYHFRFQAGDAGGGVQLRAKIWAAGSSEPGSWQIDCTTSSQLLVAGAPGVWSMGAGAKQWDDLSVRPLDAGATPQCAVDADCLDDDRCNGDESCSDGRCVGGSFLDCAVNDVCRVGVCDPATGCATVPVSDGTECSFADACISSASCQSGLCTAQGSLSCADPGPCHSGYCDSAVGCTSAPLADGTACSDGNPETEADACQAGSCIGVVPVPEPTPTPTPAPTPTPTPEPTPEPTPGPGEPLSVLFFDDFEDSATGADPTDWLHTASGNSLLEAPGLFTVVDVRRSGHALGTRSEQSHVHSHYRGESDAQWWDYEYSGRMRIDHRSGGIGVTILSDYPNSDSYLRLRRDKHRPTFQLAPHSESPGDVCVGQTDTGVSPRARKWYAFRFRTIEQTDGILVQAKVWDERDEEPLDWQVSCTWTAWSNAEGRPGVWSMGAGQKLWDDLEAIALPPVE